MEKIVLTVRIEGPYYGSYSLAKINIELIKSLSSVNGVKVLFSATSAESYTRDFSQEALLKDYGEYIDVRDEFNPDIVIRHTWPIESSDLKGGINSRIFPWEETAVPSDFVDQFNRYYDVIICPSQFVQDVLRYNGVKKTILMKNTVFTEFKKSNKKHNSVVKYFHNSSCFIRKAPDKLINAYCKAFEESDDVSLTIKTGYNPHLSVNSLIEKAREKFGRIADTIIVVDKDLSDDEISELTCGSDFTVYPSRGEGFGIPVLESHLAGVPCILPKTSALAELFVEGADFEILAKAEYSRSHTAIVGSLWWEPDLDSLVKQFKLSRLENKKLTPYKERCEHLDGYEWESWYDIAVKLVGDISSINSEKFDYIESTHMTVISTYDSVCGIAEYTRKILDKIDGTKKIKVLSSTDPSENHLHEVINCWTHWGDCGGIFQNIKHGGSVLVQHHTAFFSTGILYDIIKDSLAKNNKVIVEFHSVLDDRHEPNCYKILCDKFVEDSVLFIVHSLRELVKLNPEIDLKKNIRLVPHPFDALDLNCELRSADNSGFITCFGFMRSHKGYRKIIEALKMHVDSGHDTKLIMLTSVTNNKDSIDEFNAVTSLIDCLGLRNHVKIIRDFLDNDVASAIIAYSECCIFPYNDVAEGASGAVRVALSAGVPVICSAEAKMFDELTDHVAYFDSASDLSLLLGNFMSDRAYREKHRSLSKRIATTWSYECHSRFITNFFTDSKVVFNEF